MSAINPYYRDIEKMTVEETVSYLIEQVERCGNSASIMASFECSFKMGENFSKNAKKIESALRKKGYSCHTYEEFVTCPVTGKFLFMNVKKL